MATTIKQLLLKGTTTGVYVRTSSGAVNCDPNLWNDLGVTLTQQSYTDPTDGTTKKTRLVLSEVLNKVPDLIDKKIGGLTLSIDATNNALLLKLGTILLGSVILPTGGEVIKSSTISSEATYDNLLNEKSLQNDNQALSSAATMKVLGLTVGWVKNEIDSL